MDKILLEGFREARAITKKYAKTFYFSSLFLPKAKRNAAYSVYAICQINDEAADNLDAAIRFYRLKKIKEMIDAAYGQGPLQERLFLAFRDTVKRYRIPREYLTELSKGMQMDLEKNRYATFDELYTYCYRVAGVVGLIMLKIFGVKQDAAQKYAVDLGVAMQLTNILRDIKDDLARGRIYLPQDELKEFGVQEKDLSRARINLNFQELMQFQIKRAREFYERSAEGIKMLPDAACRSVTLAMSLIYLAILEAIEGNGYDVFRKPASVSNLKKCAIFLRVLLKGK